MKKVTRRRRKERSPPQQHCSGGHDGTAMTSFPQCTAEAASVAMVTRDAVWAYLSAKLSRGGGFETSFGHIFSSGFPTWIEFTQRELLLFCFPSFHLEGYLHDKWWTVLSLFRNRSFQQREGYLSIFCSSIHSPWRISQAVVTYIRIRSRNGERRKKWIHFTPVFTMTSSKKIHLWITWSLSKLQNRLTCYVFRDKRLCFLCYGLAFKILIMTMRYHEDYWSVGKKRLSYKKRFLVLVI